MASRTARSVAARRLTFPRQQAPWQRSEGVDADDMLARDIVGVSEKLASLGASDDDLMHKYIAARTAFVDAALCYALDASAPVEQVVIAGAGYDARSLRYAKDGVRYFELDRAETQRDKRERLQRLGVNHAHVAFVECDFRDSAGLVSLLVSSGFDSTKATLFICEGVTVYLEVAVLDSLFRALRSSNSNAATRFLVTLAVSGMSEERRAAFAKRVAAVNEPVLNFVDAIEEGPGFLERTGWRVLSESDDFVRAVGSGVSRAFNGEAPQIESTTSRASVMRRVGFVICEHCDPHAS